MIRVRARTVAAVVGIWLTGCSPAILEQISFEGRCIAVRDGDTIDVRKGRDTVRVRLHGIDAPERTQPFSNVARRRTDELVHDRWVRIEVKDRDRYARIVGRVWVDGRDLSQTLVSEGLAWHYTRYSSDPRLAYSQVRARQKRLGLWQDRNPEPPWEFRRRQRTSS